jgi:hypothetical protein
MKNNISRRHFLETASLTGTGLSLALPGLGSHGGSAYGAGAIRKIQSQAADLAKA